MGGKCITLIIAHLSR